MKRQSAYVCRVEDIRNDVGYVTLCHRLTGERFAAQIAIVKLLGAGIRNGDEFMCVATRNDVAKLRRLKPKTISAQQAQEIAGEVDSRLK